MDFLTKTITMLIQKRYNEIREQIQDGDVIAFSGKGHVSELIKLFTMSPVSHVAIVIKSQQLASDGYVTTLNHIIESTTLNGFAGVTVNRLSNRLKDYDGAAWWLPLSSEIRKKIDFITFYNWLKSQKRKLYDTWQAIGSGFDLVINNKEDFNKFFCSELVAAALEKAGGIPETNCSEITPAELCSWNIYEENYYQLTGELREIKRFNKVSL